MRVSVVGKVIYDPIFDEELQAVVFDIAEAYQAHNEKTGLVFQDEAVFGVVAKGQLGQRLMETTKRGDSLIVIGNQHHFIEAEHLGLPL
jgi:hypothetical protein